MVARGATHIPRIGGALAVKLRDHQNEHRQSREHPRESADPHARSFAYHVTDVVARQSSHKGNDRP